MTNLKNNPTLRLLHAHTSVRHFRNDVEVPMEDERVIVEAAQRASTSCNLQAYSFISVRDPQKKAAISEAGDGVRAAVDAPLLLMVCVDLYRLNFAAGQAKLEFYQAGFLETYTVGVVDAAVAAQNAAVAAESMGYGVCYLGCLRSGMDKLLPLLGLPERVFPLFGLAIGIPAWKNPVRPRLPAEGVWFQEKYDTAAAEKAVIEYDRTMAASDAYKDREYGWIEHSARRISSRLNKDVRPFLRQILERLGFGFK